MAFDEVLLPTDMDYGTQGGPGFKTNIVVLDSGHERRNRDWQDERGEWNVIYDLEDQSEIDVLNAFWRNRFGRANGFRFKDHMDFSMARQIIGATDAATTTYQIYKRYTSLNNFDSNIYKVLSGAESVWVNNVAITEGAGASQYQLDDNTGIVTLGATLAAQSGTDVEVALTEFHRPVRFDTDKPVFIHESYDRFQWSVDIIEIRDIA